MPLPATDKQAEGFVLGAAMSNRDALAAVCALSPDAFTPGRFRDVFEVIVALDAQGTPVGPETVRAELERRGTPGGHGGFVFELFQHAPPTDAGYWVGKVAEAAESRRVLYAGQHLIQLAGAEPGEERRQAILATLDTLRLAGTAGPAEQQRLVAGGRFVLDAPQQIPAVWGRGDEVLWAEGEALMICGPSGVGKTTLAGQLVAGRLGLLPSVLGYPVARGLRKVLYLAMDRPQQAARALRRLFRPEVRDVLDERLIVWTGPPPYDLARHTGTLAAMCQQAEADTVIVDSLKDAALGLSDDEVGAGYNRARQHAIVTGVQVAELHHQRKTGSNGGAPKTIDDVYGSVWLTGGAGSVIVLWGAPGDPVVELRHLKQPAEEIGPLQVIHDHRAGHSSIHHAIDVVQLARQSRHGVTAKAAACVMFGTDKPTPSETEKARRKLDSLVQSGHLIRKDGTTGGARGGHPSTYHDASFLDLEEAVS